MENYTDKCKKNLLKYSMEKENYEIAVNEWYFNNEVIDNNEFTDINISRPSCELCEHEDLRWQFVIFNVNNNNQLKVGSSCIKKFNIALLEKDGRKIYGKDRNSKINKLIDLARISSSNKITFQVLNELCRINKDLEQNNMFIECWTQLKVNGTIEPKLALFLINNFIIMWDAFVEACEKEGINYDMKAANQMIRRDYGMLRKFGSKINPQR